MQLYFALSKLRGKKEQGNWRFDWRPKRPPNTSSISIYKKQCQKQKQKQKHKRRCWTLKPKMTGNETHSDSKAATFVIKDLKFTYPGVDG